MFDGTAGDFPHRVNTVCLQPSCGSSSYTPEVGKRLMVPQFLSVALLVQLGNAHTVLVGRDMLGDDIHCHLAEIQIRSDACRRRNARFA